MTEVLGDVTDLQTLQLAPAQTRLGPAPAASTRRPNAVIGTGPHRRCRSPCSACRSSAGRSLAWVVQDEPVAHRGDTLLSGEAGMQRAVPGLDRARSRPGPLLRRSLNAG